jgi:hypothetical protein
VVPLLSRTAAEVVDLADPWANLYTSSRLISAGLKFLHLSALIVAGGFALSADRSAWRGGVAVDRTERERCLLELRRSHRIVARALGVVLVSGALLALADVEGVLSTPLFPGKLLLVAALLANGAVMARTGRTLHRGLAHHDSSASAPCWIRLRVSAVLSGVLWMATVLAGTLLANP